jgi:hypothetical protein
MEGGKEDTKKENQDKFYSEDYFNANYTTINDDDNEKAAKEEELEAMKARFP